MTVAAGAPYNNGGGIKNGHARIYKFKSNDWKQEGKDIDGESNSDNSGSPVSLSGDGSTIIVGAPNNSGNGILRGQVRVYKNQMGNWIQQSEDINGESDKDGSGFALCINSDGTKIAIGAPFNSKLGFDRGHVRVYHLNYPTSIQKTKIFNLNNLYPNPFAEILNLDISLKPNETANITITDMLGKIVFNQTASNSKTALDLKQIDAGVYNAIIQIGDIIKTVKVVKL